MLSRNTVLAAAVALATTAAFACGPSTPGPEGPTTTGTAPTSTPSDPAPDAAGGGSATPAPDASGADPAPAPKKVREAVLVQPTTMLADLKKIGLDPKKLPPLEKIPLAQKKKLMPLFQKSLGMESCEGCHVEGDFKKETKNIKMARGMWNNYVASLRDEKGGLLFCDSCHNGKEDVLPRGDKEAMNKFMTEQYEQKLTRADGEDHSCTTCHTDTMEFHIFKDVWGIK